MTELLPAIEIDPPRPPGASVIWMHGLGATGHDFEPLVPELGLVNEKDVRFVLPHAPDLPVTLNAGYRMPAWYDIHSLAFSGAEDEDGIRRSEQAVLALIERERSLGVPTDRIVLAGFSQGGAMALHTGLRFPEPLAGLMVLSAYLPLADRLEAEIAGRQGELSIFMAHGSADEIVAPTVAARSRQRLEAAGCQVEWHDYPMPHSVCPEEVGDIRDWLLRVLY